MSRHRRSILQLPLTPIRISPQRESSSFAFTLFAPELNPVSIDKVEATGATCHLHPFLAGFAPDVICHYPSLLNSTEHIILSAHYDSRGSFGQVRAPGGDDDGSGSGHLLGVAEAVKSQGVQFEKAVTFAFFAGEEQGLYGSHYYAGGSRVH